MTAEQLAERLGGKRSGRQFSCPCPAHDDRRNSLIVFDGVTAVQVRCMAGCEPDDIIDALDRRGLWGDDRLITAAKPAPRSVGPDRHRERAQVLFDDAVPILGTMAEKYFESRDLLDVAVRCSDIRFHRFCWRSHERQAAVVIAMRSVVTGAVCAVQRIFLRKQYGAVVKDGAMMLGPASGCAMQLQARGAELNIAEGLESALAVWAMDHAPVWALGSASLIRTLPVLEGVQRLVIWADHDAVNAATGKRAGGEAAEVCARRWVAAGRAVEIVLPKHTPPWDPADVWSERCGRG